MAETAETTADRRAEPAAAVALVSGGLDSGTALALWCEDRPCRLALFLDYGQRAARPEAARSRRLAERFGVPWTRVDLGWLGELARRAGSAHVAGGPPLPVRTVDDPGDAASAAAVWVPARNLVLLAVASAHAEALGCAAVVAGFNREEAETFPDNSRPFLDAVNAALRLGARARVRVESPTLAWSKAEIVAAARRRGLGRDDFWSCYGGGERPCGRCESCVRAARAWD